MKPQVKRNLATAQKLSSQNAKDFHTFLLMQQLAAKEIGQRIAQARKEAGMNQDELAELVDVSRRSLQGYEAGEVIPYKHFRTLAEVLNRPVGWFLHGEPDEPPSPLEDPAVVARLDRIEQLLEALVAPAGQGEREASPENG